MQMRDGSAFADDWPYEINIGNGDDARLLYIGAQRTSTNDLGLTEFQLVEHFVTNAKALVEAFIVDLEET